MENPNKLIVDMVTEFLEEYINDDDGSCRLPIVLAYTDDNGMVTQSFVNCNYGDLRRIAMAINDEATLQMIACNQDRIEHLVEQAEQDEQADDAE